MDTTLIGSIQLFCVMMSRYSEPLLYLDVLKFSHKFFGGDTYYEKTFALSGFPLITCCR